MGRTIIAFLPPIDEVFIDTGRREYSGTGRNQKTTRIVELYSNYNAIPIEFRPILASGTSIKLTTLGQEVLGFYWAEFAELSEFKVLLPSETTGITLTTKIGDKPVGAILRSKTSTGSLVLLPDIQFDRDEFYLDEVGEDESPWTPEGERFAAKVIGSLVALDKSLHSSAEVTPEPTWATDSAFALKKEEDLLRELLDAEREVEAAQKRKDAKDRLSGAGRLRALLYEKGKPLERALIEALEILGFRATSYKEGSSEFDVVFESEEGRLLGEAEGKDNKAINVDKLRQLAMNIHEDLLRDEVNSPAKGVLFGNGFRLLPPASRETQFTQKCITAAASSGTALISTSEIFYVARYLSNSGDSAFAKSCEEARLEAHVLVAGLRESLISGNGLVRMPALPADLDTRAITQVDQRNLIASKEPRKADQQA